MKRYIAALLCLTAISAFGCRDGGSSSTPSSGRRTESTVTTKTEKYQGR